MSDTTTSAAGAAAAAAFAWADISTSNIGTPLMSILNANDIQPGSEPSYQLCKTIYTHHTLGRKLAESPIAAAQSLGRLIVVENHPDLLVKAFEDEWLQLGCDRIIRQTVAMSRVYGIASVAAVSDKLQPKEPLPLDRLAGIDISFNVFDPLNTSGSLVMSQDPNSPGFLKSGGITVNGQSYHPTRTCVKMNEEPVYISWTSSAYGFTGRSIYQRALFPLKTFVQTMLTDDMVARKAGLLIAKQKQPGAIMNRLTLAFAKFKRDILKMGQTGNVLTIDIEESIETLDMQNIDKAGGFARSNVLKNIATAADMPAQWLNNETMVEGFGEGTEDAKNIARYVDGVRTDAKPLYDFFDAIVMRKAWTPDFYRAMKSDYPDLYSGVSFEAAFMSWQNAFRSEWPSTLIEPESDQVGADDVKLKALIALLQVMLPAATDPQNKAAIFQFAQDNINQSERLFPVPLTLDIEALQEAAEEMQKQQQDMHQQAMQEPGAPPPFSARDSVRAFVRR